MMRVMASLTKAATVAADPGERAFMQHRLAEPIAVDLRHRVGSGQTRAPQRTHATRRSMADYWIIAWPGSVDGLYFPSIGISRMTI